MWRSTTLEQIAGKMDVMRKAEAKLLALAEQYFSQGSSLEIQPFDHDIPRSAVPGLAKPQQHEDPDKLVIHGIRAQQSKLPTHDDESERVPLVILHGYMNASGYFYRNLPGLAKHFASVYALDLLGWGLSSRPQVSQGDLSVAEDFYVESLEAWRSSQSMDKMILAGHSMGGYISVAYSERYPQRVERLILLSPMGVPDETDPSVAEKRDRRNQVPWQFRWIFGTLQALFPWTTVGGVLRSMSTERSFSLVQNYIQRRLPAIANPEEQDALAKYLHTNATLPGSGEYSIQTMLHSNIMARHPLQERIPSLKVPNISFLYGIHDWMDVSAAMTVQRLSQRQSENDKSQVNVFMVEDAGHLLMLENYRTTNAIMIQQGLQKGNSLSPISLEGTEGVPDRILRKQWLSERYQETTPNSSAPQFAVV